MQQNNTCHFRHKGYPGGCLKCRKLGQMYDEDTGVHFTGGRIRGNEQPVCRLDQAYLCADNQRVDVRLATKM